MAPWGCVGRSWRPRGWSCWRRGRWTRTRGGGGGGGPRLPEREVCGGRRGWGGGLGGGGRKKGEGREGAPRRSWGGGGGGWCGGPRFWVFPPASPRRCLRPASTTSSCYWRA